MDIGECRLLEVLHEGTHTIIYRAAREGDGKTDSIALKVPKSKEDYSLEDYHSRLAIVLLEMKRQSLATFLAQQPLNLHCFLQIAIQLTTILAQLYQSKIIHKDLNSHNIMINPDTFKV